MENIVKLPDFFIQMLENQYGTETKNLILEGFTQNRVTSFRVNTLKTSDLEIEEILNLRKIPFLKHDIIPHAYMLPSHSAKDFYTDEIVTKGLVYFQSLSSMIPPLFLDPKENEAILDMAAAPGGKTTEIAAMTSNLAQITAIEVNKIRSDRLKHNLMVQGATNVYVMNQDAKRLDDFFSFDKILLDAPCSGSGTLLINDKKAIEAFSYPLIKNSAKLQEELLRKAIRILKKGHEMIYSTCSILSIENEDILLKVLKSQGCEIVPIQMNTLPTLKTKIPGVILVCPTKEYEGFFIAKIRKK